MAGRVGRFVDELARGVAEVPVSLVRDELAAALDGIGRRLVGVTSAEELRELVDDLSGPAALIIGSRQHMAGVQRGRAVPPSIAAGSGRPQPYQDLLGRYYEALWSLTALPTGSGQPGGGAAAAGSELTRQEAAVELARRVTALELAMAEWDHAASESAAPGEAAETLTAVWESGRLPDGQPLAEVGERIQAAETALKRLLDRIDDQVEQRRRVPVWEQPDRPPGWRPRERFAPPAHLLATGEDVGPSLGTEDVTALSQELVDRLKEQVLVTLPPALKHQHGAAVVTALEQRLSREKLLDHADELIADVYRFEVAGYTIEVSLELDVGGWEQVSDALEIRTRDVNAWRQARAARRARGYLLDTSVSHAFTVESRPGAECRLCQHRGLPWADDDFVGPARRAPAAAFGGGGGADCEVGVVSGLPVPVRGGAEGADHRAAAAGVGMVDGASSGVDECRAGAGSCSGRGQHPGCPGELAPVG